VMLEDDGEIREADGDERCMSGAERWLLHRMSTALCERRGSTLMMVVARRSLHKKEGTGYQEGIG